MAFRDRTAEFVKYRTAYNTTGIPKSPHVTPTDSSIGLFDSEINLINKEFAEVTEIYKKLEKCIQTIKRITIADNTKEKTEIENYFKESKKKLDGSIAKLKIVVQKSKEVKASPPEHKILDNRIRKLLIDVEELPKYMRTLRIDFDNYMKLYNPISVSALAYSSATNNDKFYILQQDMQDDEEISDAEKQADQRLKEITDIANSIVELASMFNELSIIVSAQGEVLDRIDHNIETTVVRVDEGKENLHHAEENQKGANKWGCCAISIIMVLIVIMLIMIVVRETNKQNSN